MNWIDISPKKISKLSAAQEKRLNIISDGEMQPKTKWDTTTHLPE